MMNYGQYRAAGIARSDSARVVRGVITIMPFSLL